MDISDRKGFSASGLPSARGRLRRTSILALLLAIAPIRVFAQDGLFDYQEYEKRVKSAQGLTAISADAVFGDRTSSFDGSTDFYVEDVSLPGNFDLPVSVARRFGVESVNRAINGSEATGLTLFDDWEIEVPHLSGVWTNATGWVTSTGGALTTQRCTANTAPLVIDGHGYDNIGFGIDVKWVKGASEQLLVPDDLNYASAPGLEDPKWITASKARFTCLSSTRNGYPGEGFIGYTPDGKKYFFDWGVEKPYAVAKYSDGAASRIVNRKRVYLLASRIEDRFGNWVTYSYTGYRLNSIEASDGRLITLTYDGQGRVKTVSANGRVWNYAYAEATNNNDAGLAKVTLPDGSSWAYSHSGRLQSRAPYRNAEDSGVCSNAVGSARRPTQMVVNAPTGAKGVFDFEMTLFIRNPEACEGPQPPYYDIWSLKRRTISGPGLSTMVTSWTYDARPAGDTARGRWVSRLQPDGVEVRERFSIDPTLDERKLGPVNTYEAHQRSGRSSGIRET
ncbi:hypothetical protein [Xanthomonas graminis]|jgi:YD repeat-containing protein|uniref:hypothetical protein n=1 Tax=Xanthomonas graminis TaxID=3390026 RepID=UPI000A728D10|nr:hypothetical protein [Xanthomonas translucens]UKE55027.1 hypothetical protein KFS84_03945 [Xanthomonas translucens pv. graminis]WIH08307.1 hypothetical protein KM579_18140 [Xanthomonas translucens pv. graminis]WIH12704.1 hypothetical protein KM563_02365 [Xanthomonas translucens pv. graminis]